MDVEIDIPTTLIAEHEYQESNSGSYSTTTTLSMQKNDLLGGKPISIPPTIRWVSCSIVRNAFVGA